MKYWHATPEQTAEVVAFAKGLDARSIIDIGGNDRFRFPNATTIGWEGDVKLNLACDRLPYDDQSVDFVYCRHTIEDLGDPTHLLREIQRVAKAGYIETPSPMAELTRGVDAYGTHLGYQHHRWICAIEGHGIVLIAKYPCVERLSLIDSWDILQENHRAWNTRLFFRGRLQFSVCQNESGFSLGDCDERGIPVKYLEVLNRWLRRSRYTYT